MSTFDKKQQAEIKEKSDALTKNCQLLLETQQKRGEKSGYKYDELGVILDVEKKGISFTEPGQLKVLGDVIENFKGDVKSKKFDFKDVLKDRDIDKLLPTITKQIKELNTLLGFENEKPHPKK